MSYQFDARVRYSEVDMDRRLKFSSVLSYFQDCSSFHSEDLGVGIDYLREIQRVWFLAAWQIVVGRRPSFGEQITVQTWPYEFKGFVGGRNFCMLDKRGGRLAWANSIWTYMDAQSGRPARIPENEISAYGLQEKLDMEYAPRKIVIPADCRKEAPFEIRRRHLDTNRHVNNGQYVQMAMGFLPEGFEIGQMRAEYKKPALLGNRVVPLVHLAEGICTVALCNEAEKPYAVIEFQKRQ